jgi:carboxylesterase
LVSGLARAGFAVHAPLLPGHGTHVIELQEARFSEWCAFARRELEAAREAYGAVVVCGFSLGSLVAIRLASEGHSGVAGLIAIGNPLALSPLLAVPFALASFGVDGLGVELPDVYLVKPRAGDLEDKAAAVGMRTYDRHPLRAALEVYRATRLVRAEARRVRCPTLVLHGAKDRVCGVRGATWLAEHVASDDVTLRIYPRSAHVVARDHDKDAVLADVLTFVRRLAP